MTAASVPIVATRAAMTIHRIRTSPDDSVTACSISGCILLEIKNLWPKHICGSVADIKNEGLQSLWVQR